MGRIFLSYAREDITFAQCAARVLEGAGHSVWWDRHIDGGEDFAALIEAELDKADVVLVGWSKESVRSRWVRDEAAVGGDTGRLLPVSIDGSPAPMGFRQFQTLDLSGWKGAARDARTAELVNSVERRMAGAPGADAKRNAEKAHEEPKHDRNPGPPRGLLNRPSVWMGAVGLLLALLAGLYLMRAQPEARGPLPKPTIALLPFTTVTDDAALRDIAVQAHDSISHTLPQSGIPVRLLSSVPQNSSSAGDFLLSGEMSRIGDKIVATVHLDETAHGVTVLSRRIEAQDADAQFLPERVGVRVAGLFDGATLLILDRRRPLDPGLMAELLAEPDDQLQRFQITKRVAAKAPNDPNAHIGVAFFTGFVLGQLPRDERPQAIAEGRQATQRALALAPDFGDTYATWCLLHSDALLSECEKQLRTGIRIDPDAPYLNGFLSGLMREVGRFDEAADLARLSYTHDPYNQFKISGMLYALEYIGEADRARELYGKAVRWWPENSATFFRNRMWGLLERGDLAGIRRLEIEVGKLSMLGGYQTSQPIVDAIKSKSAGSLQRVCKQAEDFTFVDRCMFAFATLGDLDSAFAIADKLFPRRVGRSPAETERIWLDDPDDPPREFLSAPAAAPMRRDPRFLVLAQRLGLLDYWRGGHVPDFCRQPRAEAICTRL